MRAIVFAVFLSISGAAHAGKLPPIACAQVADALYMLIHGQPVQLPDWMRPFLVKAAEHYQKNPGKDPYWHSTRLLLECLRTNGDLEDMYHPSKMQDPAKVPVSL
jgi:hypothetical protein